MPTLPRVLIASTGLIGLAAAALCSCAGPQPLSRAINDLDERQYRELMASGGETPGQAYLRTRAASLRISVDEARRRDDALSSTDNPFDAYHDQSAVSRGAVIYNHECVACHGENVDGRGPALAVAVPALDFHRSALRWDVTMRGGPAGKWFNAIQNGGSLDEKLPDGSPVTLQMPPFAERLSREQTWLVVTYLQSLDCDLPDSPSGASR